MSVNQILNSCLPFQLNTFRLKYSIFFSGYLLFILFVFQPFGTYEDQMAYKYLKLSGYLLITFLCSNFLPLPIAKRILHYNRSNWTVAKEILLWTGVIIIISFISSVYFYEFISSKSGLFAPLWQFQIWGVLIFSLPVGIILYSLIKKNNYEKVIAALQVKQPETLTLYGLGYDEKLTFLLKEIMLIKASDNYVEIFLNKPDGQLKKQVLRIGIGKIQEQLSNYPFYKVHRSYIVNLLFSPSIHINNNKTELSFAEHNIQIPISKTYFSGYKSILSSKPL